MLVHCIVMFVEFSDWRDGDVISKCILVNNTFVCNIIYSRANKTHCYPIVMDEV